MYLSDIYLKLTNFSVLNCSASRCLKLFEDSVRESHWNTQVAWCNTTCFAEQVVLNMLLLADFKVIQFLVQMMGHLTLILAPFCWISWSRRSVSRPKMFSEASSPTLQDCLVWCHIVSLGEWLLTCQRHYYALKCQEPLCVTTQKIWCIWCHCIDIQSSLTVAVEQVSENFWQRWGAFAYQEEDILKITSAI